MMPGMKNGSAQSRMQHISKPKTKALKISKVIAETIPGV